MYGRITEIINDEIRNKDKIEKIIKNAIDKMKKLMKEAVENKKTDDSRF